MSKNTKRNLLISTVLVLAATITLSITNRRNFHLIESHGKNPIIFRSAQLKPNDLESIIKKHKIDIVMNLRGESDKDWYTEEQKLCKKLGVKYYTHGFSMYRPPDRERFLQIIDVLEEAKTTKKRLLIHCRAGSDRTGLISSVAQMYLYDFSVNDSLEDSFRLWYGHIPDKEGAIEQIIARYKPYEKQMSFREWVETKYDREAILKDTAKQ